jgi:5-methylthioadenosine/S-adenosylhomocysteine deaminase
LDQVFTVCPAVPRQEKGQPTMSKELLIKGGHVVTVDPDLGDLPTGDVLVSDGVITAVGQDLRPATADAEVIDAVGRLVIPGMVDTHRHVWQGAIGGYTPQVTGVGYGPAVLTGIALKHAPDDVYAGTLWGALQALDAGITTIADWAHNDQSPAHADADLRGLRDSGIRGYFLYGGPGPATDDPNPPHPADARRMRDEYFASGSYGRLRMGMALRGPAFTSAGRNIADFTFARDLGLPISIHVGMAGTGDAVTILEKSGLLGSDINYVHGNFLTDREWDLLAASGGTLTITPSTDMLMQFGTFPATGAAVSRGIVSGFGIDTICSAGNDLVSEMRLALAAERSRANAAAISSEKMAQAVDLHQRDMLRLATVDGARVWGLEGEVGTLTPGKQADIAIIDLRSPHLDGFGDPVSVMVLGAGPADVETVMVGGDIVKRDGKLTGDRAGHALELMHATRQRLRS